ncbi:MAG: IS3 family transposase [Gammaproteobacteria bacterium]|nr:IS3 family transposase [Gammaproteobacteria bacterium]
MCRVEVSRLGYHAWKRRGLSARSMKDIELTGPIERAFGDAGGADASPKVHQTSVREGKVCGKNRIARIMREQGLVARCVRS